MKSKKVKEDKFEHIEGQLSLWDIISTESVKELRQIKAKVEIKENLTVIPILTPEQQCQYQKYLMKNDATRIIRYCGGGLGIEFKEGCEFKSLYINKAGEIVFECDRQLTVIPMDRILYCKEKTTFNAVQTDKIHELLCNSRDKIQRVIKRNGDNNVLIEFSGKVISILPNGWTLEYESIAEVECSQEEIFLIPTKVEKQEIKLNPLIVKVGDHVKAMYGKEVIEGEIVQAYNGTTLNIIFDNKTKHTAIHRSYVIKVLISA